MSKFKRQYISAFIIIVQLCSCLTAGTHGSIKAYDFFVSKKILQKAVEKIIAESSDIHRDSVKNYIVNITDGKNDTVINNHYNDGQNYVTIKIENNKKSGESEFTFQYVGDKKDWDTMKTSSLSIAYAYDENGRGGSNEDGGISSAPLLRKNLINLFESKFINRIKTELGEQ